MRFSSLPKVLIAMSGFLALGVLAPRPTLACSGKLLTPEDLVEWTEVIVSVRAVREHASGTPEKLGLVDFDVIDVMKGSLESETLRFPGQMQSYPGRNKSDPPYRAMRKPDTAGRCFVTAYVPGKQYLLFLRRPHHFWHSLPRGGSELTPYWTILAPTTEEVSGKDDPWIKWVEARLSIVGATLGAEHLRSRRSATTSAGLKPCSC